MYYRARLANHHLAGSSVSGDDYVDQVHAFGVALGVEGEGMFAFGDIAKVAVHDEAAVDVVDTDDGIAGDSSVKVEVSLSTDRVGVEIDLVKTNSVDSGDVDGGSIILGVDNFVGEVSNILHVHKDTTSVGTEVDSAGPLGFGKGEFILGDTCVGDVVSDGQFAGLLADGRHRDTSEVIVGLPSGVAVFGEDTIGGANIDGTIGDFYHGAVGGKRRIGQGGSLNRHCAATRIVKDHNVGERGVEVFKGNDETILTFAGVDSDVADRTGEPSAVVVVNGVDMEG